MSMKGNSQPPIDRNLGEQPIARLLSETGLAPRDLVAAAPDPITFKMVARACKGRRLTPRAQQKVLNALNKASGKTYRTGDCFNY